MNPQKFYAIGEAARLAGTTIETLRHYDRVGLLKPARTDDESRYRYYTDTELIYLEVISFCRKNGMPLAEIKKLLNADFSEVVSFLQSMEAKVDVEVQRLLRTKEQISTLRRSLEEYSAKDAPCVHTKFFEQRAILLAEQLGDASVENFRRLHQEIRQRLGPDAGKKFTFDHSANLLIRPRRGGRAAMFAVCTSYADDPALRFLGAGEYLCCECAEADRDETVRRLLRAARERCDADPQYGVLHVRFVGLFQWRYEVQIPLFQEPPFCRAG